MEVTHSTSFPNLFSIFYFSSGSELDLELRCNSKRFPFTDILATSIFKLWIFYSIPFLTFRIGSKFSV